MIAVRGAIRVERNDRRTIYRSTQRLLRTMQRRNGLEESDVVSAFFTMTPDLNADFPAYAARDMGWTDTAMLGAQETAVPGALDRMVRVLLHADVEGPARHVYLGEAAAMRPDLAEEGDTAAAAGAASPDRSPAPFGPLLVVGLGLIGGSAALALRRRGLFTEVVGQDVAGEARDQARRAGAVDRTVPSPKAVLDRADTVLLALPVQALVDWLESWGEKLPRGTVVVDVGSTKREIVRAMEALPKGVEAVGAHPMAGSEESGMGAARPDLFHGARWALVETSRTGDRARQVAEAIVDGVDGVPFWVGAETHDRAAAATSHLPYLLSVALTRHLGERTDAAAIRELVGPGAKDMLRLAGSDPTLMADILGTNWPAVREEVARFGRTLSEVATLLDERAGGRPERLRDVLDGARRTRHGLLEDRDDRPRSGTPDGRRATPTSSHDGGDRP